MEDSLKKEMEEEANPDTFEFELYNADEDCEHDIQPASGGGVKCLKCNGWFCY
ncbi:hypothetical protein ACQUY5_26900 [Bacillus cereus]|uniref:hypothetical protein n=1 Tax=Bacillus cereus TaxID=1396 RepID=UPI003D16C5ED